MSSWRDDWTVYPQFPARNLIFLACKLLKYEMVGNGIEGGFHKNGTIYWFSDDGKIWVSGE